MKSIYTFIVLLFSVLSMISKSYGQDNAKSNLTLLSDQIPIDTALIFAPGIISTEPAHESSITFNSDMTELFFGRRIPKDTYKIYSMKLIDGKWSKPELVLSKV